MEIRPSSDSPPPAYYASDPLPAGASPPATLIGLPSQLLIYIVSLVPAPFLHGSLRRVNRSLYLVTMHLLRDAFVGSYRGRVKQPYSTDALGGTVGGAADARRQAGAVVPSAWRETRVLDLYIALRLHQLVMMNESSLNLNAISDSSGFGWGSLSDASTLDLFDRCQPQARCEDLFITIGVSRWIVVPLLSSSARKNEGAYTLSMDTIVIRFSLRKLSLVLPFQAATRGALVGKTVVEVSRGREESLEISVRRLLTEVERMLDEKELQRVDAEDGGCWYLRI